ncbi:membrane protein [Alishewanella longhuensis]|uniref:Membrane protein n=1 Tax=Alishewanella longhuensis TaxID=1091037 RepID=A0ABQ3KY69_9ALTE|nr:DoxX family protein [Alishewanella longhuensis]GHG60703.1 membrane protein [Alishewanella longhuensis]
MSWYMNVQSRYLTISGLIQRWLEPLVLLSARLLIAKVFLYSGLSKWQGFLQFDSNKYDLFLYEFFCPETIRPGALVLCDSETMEYAQGAFGQQLAELLAFSAGILEVFLPILLVIGLLSRISALGLLTMTLFIQLAVYPDWAHFWNPAAWWLVVLMLLMVRGPGSLSIDRLLRLER